MTSKLETDRRGPKCLLRIPLDLSEWVENSVLMQWVVKEVNSLDWENPKLIEYLQQRPMIQPRMMLQLLTYSFSIASFGADEVESLFYKDKAFLALGWNQPPKVKAVSRFRRDNRGLMKWGLMQVIKRAVRQKHDLTHRMLPGLNRYIEQNAVERIDLARLIDRSASDD